MGKICYNKTTNDERRNPMPFTTLQVFSSLFLLKSTICLNGYVGD